MALIHILSALSDNYIYLIEEEGKAIVIDPSVADVVEQELKERNLSLCAILNTHHHPDHIGGNQKLMEAGHCELVAPEDERIEKVTKIARDGSKIEIASLAFNVIATPGHTTTHIAYYLPSEQALFSGDCLFNGGCGRLFEGASEQMWGSLNKLAALPKDTKVYSGHEYTEKNLLFALKLQPGNTLVEERLQKVQALRQQGKPSVPSTIEEELKTNPFLRVKDLSFKKALNMEEMEDIVVFANIRNKRNHF